VITPSAEPWLLLVHQLPPRPSRVRVKTWRRLQALGAVAVRNAVWVLPNSPQAREDFEWMKAEIGALGGQAIVFAATHVENASGEEIVAAFRAARQADFEAMTRAIVDLGVAKSRRGAAALKPAARRRIARALRASRHRLGQLDGIDFFQAPGRDEVVAAIEALESRLQTETRRRTPSSGARLPKNGFQGRRWITRPRPGVDRMSSAWLIRRFIDPTASFGFSGTVPEGSADVPFDMFGVEFGHHGPACTFETLLHRFGLFSPGLSWIARIVHTLDLKDEAAPPLPEAPGVGRLIEGLRLAYADDHELLERGMTIFEALYRAYPGESGVRRGRRRRRR
jgi:hypothetical protein